MHVICIMFRSIKKFILCLITDFKSTFSSSRLVNSFKIHDLNEHQHFTPACVMRSL